MSGKEDHSWGAWRLGLAALGMFLFGFALVPFYGLICRVTGLQQVAEGDAAALPRETPGLERFVTVRFDGRVQSDLPWEFAPLQKSLRVRVGEFQEVNFRVRNLTGRTLSGQAIPSVIPWQATQFFSKAECFCFRQQTLRGGETRDLPLRFLVSPDLPRGTESLTISYAFMALR